MPALRPMAHHERCRANGLANPAVVQELPRGLEVTAEEGVWRGPDAKPARAGEMDERFCIVRLKRERFLRVHVFARLQRLTRNVGVRLRDREIQDEIDVGMREEFVGRERRNLKLLGARRGPLRVEVRHRGHGNAE